MTIKTSYAACAAIEGCSDQEPDETDYYISIQRAINDGSAWSFEGSYGRAMMDAIRAGRCCLGWEPKRDYYGNRIPARNEVQAGTPGSVEYVAAHCGQTWASLISSPAIYVHWNGGPESILAFLEAAKRLGIRDPQGDPAYCLDRLDAPSARGG